MTPIRIAVAAALIAATVSPSQAATIFSETFEGYTSFPSQVPEGDYVNTGIPRISEGAAQVWYGARFEDPDSSSAIDTDLAVQQYGGGSNQTHTGRFEDDAGLLFRISTSNLNTINLSFNWRTFLAESSDRLVVGYHVGPIAGFGTCTGNGEAGCFADLRSSLPWYTSQTGTTLTGNWTELLRASASNNWNNQSYALPAAVANQSQVWIAFWMDNGEGDHGKVDNVLVTGVTTVVPVPAAVWLLGSALGLLGWMRRRSIA